MKNLVLMAAMLIGTYAAQAQNVNNYSSYDIEVKCTYQCGNPTPPWGANVNVLNAASTPGYPGGTPTSLAQSTWIAGPVPTASADNAWGFVLHRSGCSTSGTYGSPIAVSGNKCDLPQRATYNAGACTFGVPSALMTIEFDPTTGDINIY